jgi:hypothetical protein
MHIFLIQKKKQPKRKRKKKMKIKLQHGHEITTEHPASHYGAGVLLIEGETKAFGPGDIYPRNKEFAELLNVKNTCGDIIASQILKIVERKTLPDNEPPQLSKNELAQILKWLSQDPNTHSYIYSIKKATGAIGCY